MVLGSMPHRTLGNRISPSKEAAEDSGRYLAEISNSREAESSLRDSVRLYNSSHHQAENHSLSSVAHEPKFFFLCGRCDMLVGEDDRVCQYCGAEFVEEEPTQKESQIEDVEAESEGKDVRESIERELKEQEGPERPEEPVSRVDVLSMLADGRSRLGVENLAGGSSFAFANYARTLRRIENIISEAGDFGVETEEARRMLLAAWKACHEGKWNRAMHLAEESAKALAPGVTHLIQGQISCLREAIIEMKRRGRIVTPLVIEIKTIQRALNELRMDDAIKLTKSLIAEIKEAQMDFLNNMECSSGEALSFCGQGI